MVVNSYFMLCLLISGENPQYPLHRTCVGPRIGLNLIQGNSCPHQEMNHGYPAHSLCTDWLFWLTVYIKLLLNNIFKSNIDYTLVRVIFYASGILPGFV
jgi:hypothetical protein